MRPIIWLRVIGAVALDWIIYNTWPISLALIVVAPIGWFAFKTSHRTRLAACVATLSRLIRVDDKELATDKRRMTLSEEPASITATLATLRPAIMRRSGSVFYTGMSAFEGKHRLYILGLNPGGSPEVQAAETIERDLAIWATRLDHWSAYVDDAWQGKMPGTHGMQPRLRHMFDQLGIDLRDVPASNVVFVRSATEAMLTMEKVTLLRECWPVHSVVINELGIDTILCLGGTAGRWVRDAIGADRLVDSFSEQNARGWTSEAHLAPDGRAVVTVTHPGRADWRNAAADPTPLVRRVLDRAG